MKRSGGFTFIELLLTVLVVSALSVAAVPYFMDVAAARVESAAKKILSDLDYARRLASNRNGIYSVAFDAGSETYSISLYDPATNTETTITDPLTASPMVVNLGQSADLRGVDLQSPDFGGTATVRFSPAGIPQNGSNAALTTAGSVVLQASGQSRTVVIQPNTGEVSIQ